MIRLVVALLMGVTLLAQDEPRQQVRSRVEPEGPAMVGQPVRLIVDVLVTTWLTGAPQLPQLDLPGAVVVLPEERALNLTERDGADSWFGVSRSYLIYPQQAGDFETPEALVAIKYGGGKNSPVELPIPSARFSATIPSEAAKLGYFIPTTSFRMTQRVEPEAAEFKVGDSVQRTVEMAADGTFAMFLPPVSFDSEDGLAVYSDPPRVEDLSGDRDGFQGGRRIASASYVIEKEGEYTLPGFSFYWWDLDAGQLREAAVPPFVFTAAPDPNLQVEIAVPVEPEEVVEEEPADSIMTLARRWAVPLIIFHVAMLVGALLLRRAIPALRRRLRERRRRYEMSEESTFAALEKACRSNDRPEALRLLYIWLDRIHTGTGAATLDDALLRADSEVLKRESAALLEVDGSWDGPAFFDALRNARPALATHRAPAPPGSRLSSLNPT